MTTRNVKRGILTAGSLTIVGFFAMIAMAADEANMARETFMQTAERFGIFAAISVSLTLISVASLVWIVYYVITTFQEVVDSNTMASIKLRDTLRSRPCLTDSDIDKIEGEGSDDKVMQAIERRRARRERH